MSARKESDLDREIWNEWEAIVFQHGGFAQRPLSREASIQQAREDEPRFDTLLRMAFDGSNWLVSNLTAVVLSRSRWTNAMILGEYERASDEMVRCLKHPGPFARTDLADIPIRLHVPRVIRDGDEQACSALAELITSGVYAPTAMSRNIAMAFFFNTGMPEEALPPNSEGLRSLLAQLAVARKRPKGAVAACYQVRKWGDLMGLCEDIADLKQKSREAR